MSCAAAKPGGSVLLSTTICWTIILLALSDSHVRYQKSTAQVVSILKGDTIEVLHNKRAERVPVTGIDCPE